ncbi:MAG: hypothetical protein JXQ83_11715 [Candidatus Glassbacteria bacterium]|nr:hypothetical protein [Candidatus Glassbacteria bacterium]
MADRGLSEKKAGEFGGDKLMPLLDERSLFKERIRLLESKRDEVSEAVYLRVKADYTAKLDNLNGEIDRHAKTLHATRHDYRELLDQLRQAVDHGRRSLEELKIRFALGEYNRQEYETIGSEKKVKIDYYREKIKTYDANLQRLEGVLSQISGV